MYWLTKLAALLIGSMLVAVGVNLFLVPHQLMDGGMIGIGLLATYYMKWPPGLVMMLVSIPVYIVVFFLDRRLFFHSFHGMLISSFFIDVFSLMRDWNHWSTATSSITGGVLIGMGIGLMLAYETNTGGTDLLAQFLARRFNLRVALLILLIDGLIVACSLQAIGGERTVFSLLTIIAVAATTHMFSGLGRPKPPYTILGKISTPHAIERVAFSPVYATNRHVQKAVSLDGAREGEGKREFMEKINRKRMK
ncbi:YitT family protein [Brevibacillus choshinensis]|uniref:YitT family protein n=1 Tax=Brevibacillus choshinensis TaxID=54911 RepID=A0ABX7FIH2_BRECH|nr:YitT family protein [Brevibacillus choshinensis]QRG66019.1 YitT family protein [Brevibacillus choshinensis]